MVVLDWMIEDDHELRAEKVCVCVCVCVACLKGAEFNATQRYFSTSRNFYMVCK